MLRKLILLAISSGLAKKAWDKYHEKNTGPGVTDVKWRPNTPVPRASSGQDKTDAPGRSREPKPDAS